MTPPARPRRHLTLQPVPAVDGPYDDEPESRHRPPLVDGSLALALPVHRRDAVPLRLVPPAGGPPVDDTGDEAYRSQLPDPRRCGRRLSQALAEVLAGSRPPSQLSATVTLDVLSLLERGAGRFAARPSGPRQQPVVRTVRVDCPAPAVAEVSAVVDLGPRRRALALRLEGRRGQWWCTALQVG